MTEGRNPELDAVLKTVWALTLAEDFCRKFVTQEVKARTLGWHDLADKLYEAHKKVHEVINTCCAEAEGTIDAGNEELEFARERWQEFLDGAEAQQ